MRELDLYSDLPAAQPAPAGEAPPPPEPEGPPTTDRLRRASSTGDRSGSGAATERADDWIQNLWRGFLPAIRERFEPRAMIGEGGMGVVIEAHDRLMDRPVAIKGPRDPNGLTGDSRARQLLEAQIAARLAHPNILPVFDLWTDSRGNPWCSMLRVPGAAPTLAGYLAQLEGAPLEERPLVRLLRTFLEICRAVAWAHSAGYVHRDIKPENVFLGETGEALVADWGVATRLDQVRGGTRDRVGTRGYAAPEQLGLSGPARADERSDIYSLGVLLYEMTLGRRYARVTTASSGSYPEGEVPPEGPTIPDLVPRELAAIIERATAWDSARRQPDVKTLIREIDTYQMGGLLDGLEYGTAERLRKWMRAHPLWAGVAATGLCTALIVFAMACALRVKSTFLAKRLAQVYAEKAASAQIQKDLDRALYYSALALHTWPARYTLPSEVPYTVLAETGGRGRHLWSQGLSAVSTCVAFGPDGHTVAVAGARGDVELWDVKTGRIARRLEPGASTGKPLLAMSFADSGRLAAAGEDGVVHVWEKDGQHLPAMRGHTAPVRSLAISPDGQLIASAGDDGTARLWGLDGYAPPVSRLDVPTMGPGSLALDRNIEKLFLAARDGSLSMLDIGVREPRFLLPGMEDKRLIGHIRPGHLHGGLRHVNYFPEVGPGRQQLVAFSGASPDECSGVQLWDLTFWRDAGMLHHDRRVTSVCFSRPVTRPGELPHPLLCSASEDGVIRVWDVAKRMVKVELTGHDGSVSALAVSRDGRLLASVGADRSLRLWDIETGWQRVGLSRYGRPPADYVFGPGVQTVLEVRREDGRVTPFDVVTHSPAGDDAQVLGATRGPVVASRDGRKLAAMHADRVSVWNVKGSAAPVLEPAASVPVTQAMRAVAFTGGGRTLGLERSAAGFAVRDLAGGGVLAELRWEGREPVAVALGPDASRTVLLDDAGQAWLWEPATNGRTARLLEGIRDVTSIALASGGRGLALGDAHGRIHLWDQDPRRHVRIDAHHSPVRSIAFAPDGCTLVSTGDEPVARLWSLTSWKEPEELIAQLKRISPFEYDEAQLGLVPRQHPYHLTPWFPPDYRFPQEVSR